MTRAQALRVAGALATLGALTGAVMVLAHVVGGGGR